MTYREQIDRNETEEPRRHHHPYRILDVHDAPITHMLKKNNKAIVLKADDLNVGSWIIIIFFMLPLMVIVVAKGLADRDGGMVVKGVLLNALLGIILMLSSGFFFTKRKVVVTSKNITIEGTTIPWEIVQDVLYIQRIPQGKTIPRNDIVLVVNHELLYYREYIPFTKIAAAIKHLHPQQGIFSTNISTSQ
ncbi:hypothetical protein LX64_00708 [Chitinophaga skermanii]|uniref:Uncharacterized protein n=1 Tax=Chitinophaga skermanii TaxID=331697 RepID=A0A327R314_9BACT|nr:hypothetical protein [Chitinophaga skermanii]RAJ11100.1 hypothetical protein LX64_00708 [Chitinophaga skermanii]